MFDAFGVDLGSGFEQIEDAPEYDSTVVLSTEIVESYLRGGVAATR